MNPSAHEALDDDHFPEEDVRAALADNALQSELSQHLEGLEDRLRTIEAGLRERGEDISGASWMYFSSPDWTWEHLCGRAGLLLFDPSTGRQFAFVMTLMN